MDVGLSVIVCCYNSAKRLPQTLAHLAAQKVILGIPWEVIVVDNASTDQTPSVAKSEWQQYNLNVPLRVVSEDQPGLSYARKKGIVESKFNVLIFCDDDNWFTENYLQNAHEIMTQNIVVGAVGGEGMAITDDEFPLWFEKNKAYYACYPQAHQSGELKGRTDFLYGAGMVVRRQLMSKIYSSEIEFLLKDRTGTSLMSGGDNELCYRIKMCGYTLWYSDQLKFKHFMPADRLTQNYLLMIITAIGYSSMKLIIYHYILTGKKVSLFTWFADMAYRTANLVYTYGMTFFYRDSFRAKTLRAVSLATFKAIAHQFNTYQKTYHSLQQFQNVKLDR